MTKLPQGGHLVSLGRVVWMSREGGPFPAFVTDIFDDDSLRLDVMEPLTVRLEPPAQARLPVERLDQLEERVSAVEVGQPNSGGLLYLGVGDRQPEPVTIRA